MKNRRQWPIDVANRLWLCDPTTMKNQHAPYQVAAHARVACNFPANWTAADKGVNRARIRGAGGGRKFRCSLRHTHTWCMQRSRRQLTANLLAYALSGGAHISAAARQKRSLQGAAPRLRAVHDVRYSIRPKGVGWQREEAALRCGCAQRTAGHFSSPDSSHARAPDNIRISSAPRLRWFVVSFKLRLLNFNPGYEN
jgi:hypothetical protein